jgi:hypothetical protein
MFKQWDGGMDWIDLARDKDICRAVLNAVVNLRVAYNAGNLLNSCGTLSFSERNLFHGIGLLYRYETYV